MMVMMMKKQKKKKEEWKEKEKKVVMIIFKDLCEAFSSFPGRISFSPSGVQIELTTWGSSYLFHKPEFTQTESS